MTLPLTVPFAAETSAFAILNAAVEPWARAGLLGAPGCGWPGPIVVEVRGRKTGTIRRVPLLALRAGDTFVVSTVRGQRSQWLKNLEANPECGAWVGGRRQAFSAEVFRPGGSSPEGAIGAAVQAGTMAGLTVAVLRPLDRPVLAGS